MAVTDVVLKQVLIYFPFRTFSSFRDILSDSCFVHVTDCGSFPYSSIVVCHE